MALSAYSKGRTSSALDNYLTRARLLLTAINWDPWQKFIRSNDLAISPSYTIDETAMNAYIQKVADNIKITPQDSAVTITGGTTQLKPAIYGREVLVDKLKASVLESVKGFKSEEIVVETKSLKPAIVDNSAQEAMVQAQSVMKRPVILTYKGVEYRPNQETVASWISFTKNTGDTKYTLVIDKSKMDNYFSFLKSKINIYSTPKLVRVENGVKSVETQAGANGLLVDTNILGDQISGKLPLQASVSLEIPTYVDVFKTKYDNVIIADWDKYIDINLSTQTMTACEKGGVNCKAFKVTTGNSAHPTPAGTWLIYAKSAVTTMSGGTPGVDYYNLPGVHWVSWFKGDGYSIHEAYWRSSFGGSDYTWNGSHGCVNSPLEVAKYIYDWAPIGTPVIVHY
jgi:hypothetical protein